MGKKKGGVRVKQMGSKVGPAFNPAEDLQVPTEEMAQLPVPKDRSYQIFWPIHESFTMNIDGFRSVYPNYMDCNKSIAEGRRISKSKGCPTPTVTDVSQALQLLQIRHVIQPYKGYSREAAWDNPGRCLVDVSQYSKTELLIEIAHRIPSLKDRVLRLEREEADRVQQEEERLLAASKVPKKVVASNKKKGKKGKRK